MLIIGVSSLQTVFDLKECNRNSTLDLGMIAGIGDSVFAGYGSREYTTWPFFNPLIFREDRGATAVSGGDPDMWSVFKMAQHFIPNLKGKSTGTHFFNLCRGSLCFWPFNIYHKTDGLNVAATGAYAENIMTQAKELVKRVNVLIKQEPELQTKWKLVMSLVGLNDQFNYCNGYKSSLMYFEFYVREYIDYLRQNMEYVIIDVLSMWDLNKLVDLGSRHPACLHNNRQFLFKSCPYDKVNGGAFRKTMKSYQLGQNRILKTIVEEFQNGTAWSKKEKLASSWLGKPSTFKLIYDPSAEDMDLNTISTSFVSKTDCSHPTKAMHERLASIYWHNLFLKSGEKERDQQWAFEKGFLRFTCPTTIELD